MKDTILKGTGNSRTLKSVPNLANLAPTYEDLLALLAGDGLPVDLGPLNADGLSVRGTDLNKANLLTDATARLFGLTSTATPNSTLAKIASLISGLDADLESKTFVATGTYVGTGVAGDIVKITTGFPPKAGLIYGTDIGQGQAKAIFISPQNAKIWKAYLGGSRPSLAQTTKTTYKSNGVELVGYPDKDYDDYITINHLGTTYVYAILG